MLCGPLVFIRIETAQAKVTKPQDIFGPSVDEIWDAAGFGAPGRRRRKGVCKVTQWIQIAIIRQFSNIERKLKEMFVILESSVINRVEFDACYRM